MSSLPSSDGAAPPAALQIEDLAKRYPTGVEALRGVSLRIEAGELFGLLGPNGAGKSTLIHCTTGLAQPTAGAISVFGHDAIDHYAAARQAVGLAPQEPNLDWFLTVEETLDYHAGYFGMPRRERRQRTRELLETFSLTEKADERTRTLSGGMKRRLILARAMMHRPRLLILDEPTAGVDVELDDDPAHDPLPGGGRAALRPDRLHRRGADRRRGDQRGALRALRGAEPRGRLPGPGRAQRALALAYRGRPRRGRGMRARTRQALGERR